MKQQIVRKIIFHAGHMLKDDDSKCYHPHGHEYVFECGVTGDIHSSGAESGMIMNFGELKGLMMSRIHDEFDHKFIIQDSDPRRAKFIDAVGFEGVVVVQWTPTAENLAEYCFRAIQEKLPRGVKVSLVRITETANCWTECYSID